MALTGPGGDGEMWTGSRGDQEGELTVCDGRPSWGQAEGAGSQTTGDWGWGLTPAGHRRKSRCGGSDEEFSWSCAALEGPGDPLRRKCQDTAECMGLGSGETAGPESRSGAAGM